MICIKPYIQRSDKMSIGEKIKYLRKVKGISQEELAQKLNINRNFLSRIETEKSEPTATILKHIAQIFSISIDSLLDIKEQDISIDDKIKQLTNNIKYLPNKDLDFLIRITTIMKEEYVKNKNNGTEK